MQSQTSGAHACAARSKPISWRNPATGVAAISLFIILTLAGGNDVISETIHVPVESLTGALRILTFTAPVVIWLIPYLVVRQLRDRGAMPGTHHPGGYRVERTADGGFIEVER